MIDLSPDQVFPGFRAFFSRNGYTFRRCFAVLDGTSGGRILTDDAASPTWGAVHELSSDGTLFLGGSLTREIVSTIIETLRCERMVTIGLTADDPHIPLLPDPDREGHDMDFEDRDPAVTLEPHCVGPADLRLSRIDRELEPRCLWTPWMFQNGPEAIEHGIGYCLLDGDEVVSEAYAGPEVDGLLEIAVITREGHRRRGLATVVAARTILECERLGFQTWWNTSLANVASARIARSLGYRTEKHYRTLFWAPTKVG